MAIWLTLTSLIRGAVILLLAAALSAVQAQPAAKVFRIGVLSTSTAQLTDPEVSRVWSGFTEALQQLGYVEGRNVVFEIRSSEGNPERLPALATELVRLNVDVIIASAYAPAAAKAATSTVPIVMTNHGDPVGRGLVASLGRPGGNVTGMTALAPDLVPKQLQLLKEAIPRLSRVAVLSNPAHPNHPPALQEAEIAARRLNVRLQILQAGAPAEIAGALASATKESADAVLVLLDPMFYGERARIAGLRLPVMASSKDLAEAGCLLAYGIDHRDNYRRVATFVDKILKGAKPADLPVEQPTKFELVVNLKTAKLLNLTIPRSVLLQADQVIE